jgi:hypothetical protein
MANRMAANGFAGGLEIPTGGVGGPRSRNSAGSLESQSASSVGDGSVSSTQVSPRTGLPTVDENKPAPLSEDLIEKLNRMEQGLGDKPEPVDFDKLNKLKPIDLSKRPRVISGPPAVGSNMMLGPGGSWKYVCAHALALRYRGPNPSACPPARLHPSLRSYSYPACTLRSATTPTPPLRNTRRYKKISPELASNSDPDEEEDDEAKGMKEKKHSSPRHHHNRRHTTQDEQPTRRRFSDKTDILVLTDTDGHRHRHSLNVSNLMEEEMLGSPLGR